MKKMVFGIILLIMVFMGCSSGRKAVMETNGSSHGRTTVVETSVSSPGMDLDAAIRGAAAQMEAKIPSKTMVALVSVASPSTAFSTQVLTRLESAIVSSGKLVVVDRANLDKVREEQGFQLSGEVDDESAKSIGKLLGAGAIVTGSLADLGDVYSLTLKAINIETATVAVSYLADLAKSTRVETLLASSGGAGDGTRATQAGGDAAGQPTASAAPVYKVGDTGPAGGLIFHDKGTNSGGWRYLEAAPAETEAKLKWFTTVAFFGTKTDLGTGKANTQVIIADFSQGVPEAALHCSELEYNGFKDWFLPSKDELNLMYINLKRRNIGGFAGDWYWSSSEQSRGTAYNQNFNDGSQLNTLAVNMISAYRVRAIRQF
jgi:hypothetical protein